MSAPNTNLKGEIIEFDIARVLLKCTYVAFYRDDLCHGSPDGQSAC